jgi:ABC-type spermidine/putrescine transport system permease subunit II
MRLIKAAISTLVLAIINSSESLSQCVMCKALGEASANQGGIGTGLNAGILFLMIVPYILIATGFYLVWRRFNKEGE